MFARLIAARQVVLLYDSTSIRLFYQGQVYERKAADGCRGLPMNTQEYWPVWTLVDVDTGTGPKFEKTDVIWAIQPSSPNPDRWKRWAKQFNAPVLGAALWNADELTKGYALSLFSSGDVHH